LNLKMLNIGAVKKIGDEALDKKDTKKGVMGKLGDVVKYVIDCCKE
jgi:hypothetical protein